MDILGAFIAWPFLALVPAAVFAFLFFKSRSIVVLVVALMWLAYFPYEQAMKMRILCTGECNIRVDLVLFYPLLALASAIAVYAYFRSMHSRARVGGDAGGEHKAS
jgi:hypothetical protein